MTIDDCLKLQLLTLAEVATLLSLGGDAERTVRRLLRIHRIPTQRLGREVRLTHAQYLHLLEATQSCPQSSTRKTMVTSTSMARSGSGVKASGLERLRAAVTKQPRAGSSPNGSPR